MKYRIAISENETREVEGEIEKFADFEEFKFFSHRCFDVSAYGVSEVSTGLLVAVGRTRKMAINAASFRLSSIGLRTFRETVLKTRKVA